MFAEDYTPDNHPEYVKWVDCKYEFEYTSEFLRNSIWEAPCGLLKKGISMNWEMGYMGISWRPENNNPCFTCPLGKVDCELNHELLRGRKSSGNVQCAFHLTDRPYDYEKSVEKIEDEKEAYKNQLLEEFYQKLKRQGHCHCIRWDNNKQMWFADYNPADCARYKCSNPECVLTGKPIDEKKKNVFYDLKITRYRRDGGLWDGEEIVSIIKGKKVFQSPVSATICEAYAKFNYNDILENEKSKLHKEIFLNPDIKVEILNVRVEWRETRDLLQDLQDVANGIKVIHNSDLQKQTRAEKSERRKLRKQKRIQKLWKRWWENGDPLARKILIRKGELDGEIDVGWIPKSKAEKPESKNEQLSLFDTGEM